MSDLDQPGAAADDSDPGSPAGNPRIGVLLAVALTVLACDITSKAIVVAVLSDRAPLRLLGGLLTLRVSRNAGAAFSIGPSMTVVFSAIAVGVVVFILRASRRIRTLPWAITLGLLLGGATGNLVDRLFRYPGPLLGHVVDWIQVPHWPVFNLADSTIVCGGVLAVFLAVRGVRIDGSGDGGSGDGGSDTGASMPGDAPDQAEADRGQADGPRGGHDLPPAHGGAGGGSE